MQSPRRAFGLVLLGSLLLQAAWILTLPTFRGIDEYDHVYKAEAVASGQWLSREPAPEGRGSLVEINEQSIRDASAVCDWLGYSGRGVCHPVELRPDGKATVGTAAGAYNPSYYLIVGLAAKPFAGDAADHVMRVVTAVLCSLLLAWSAAMVALWARTAWPLLALLAGLTPMFLYSTAIATPNGLSYAGATLVWFAILALDRAPEHERAVLPAFLVGSVILLVTHTTGPMWLLLIGLTSLLMRPIREWLAILARRMWAWAATAALVVAVTLLCVIWTREARANTLAGPQEEFSSGFPWYEFLLSHVLWLLQGIGVFPTRNERAHPVVYAVWSALLIAMLVILIRRAVRRERIALTVLAVLVVTIPSVLSFLSYASEGLAWQGRYSLPLWMGVSALAARALDRAGREPSRSLVLGFFTAVALGHVASTVAVGLREVDLDVSLPTAAHLPAGFVLVALLALAGSMAPSMALDRRHGPNGLSPMTRSVTSAG